ncbi:hypothetical protein LEP1GSC172_2742 [Leptospira noguchii]|uniref:Integrase core domain protein n=4 Tax=Leptospira noguchii TaxID=28182 RepID=T0FV62_9LEPT|nr:hypothetical protein LEP1GSC172_2742 [Leptospira noguchii]EQA73450.1 hypothetical protein LEP1GSC059_0425 [Leptospira noguchii serovar Panama str. CZ214]
MNSTTALSKVIDYRNFPKGLVFHSDYCSSETRKYLLFNKIRKGNCWNKAVTEFFFGSLKREMEYNYFYKF